MINEEKTHLYCRENISLIQNYDKAISDKEQMWHCHHRLGTVIPKKKLLEMDLYDHRPALELIFLTPEEHKQIHKNGFYGKHHSDNTKQILREANIGKHHSDETKKKMSESRSGENHPFYSKHHSEKSKQKIRESILGKHRVYENEEHTKWHME